MSMLEREADSEDAVVIGGMKTGGGDLEASTESHTDSSPEAKAAEEQARGDEILFLAVIAAILKKCGVQLDLRPDLAKDTVLEGIVPSEGAPQEISVGGGYADAERAL